MKLLLDQNLSPRLVGPLQAAYPGTAHVRDFELQRATDSVVWIRLGNCTVDQTLAAIIHAQSQLKRFADDPTAAFTAIPAPTRPV